MAFILLLKKYQNWVYDPDGLHSKLRPIYPQIKMIKNCASKILETGVYPRYLKVINAKKSGHCLTSKGFIGPRVSGFTGTKIRLK